MTCDDQSLKFAVVRYVPFYSGRHGRRRFACANDAQAPRWQFWQCAGDDALRLYSLDGTIQRGKKKMFRVVHAKSILEVWCVRGLFKRLDLSHCANPRYY